MCKKEEKEISIDSEIIGSILDRIQEIKPCKSENGTILLDRTNESDRDWYEDK